MYFKRRGKAKVVLVQRKDPFPTWRLPKGHQKGREALLETARREVLEETGIEGSGGPKLEIVNFKFTHPVTKKYTHKFVHYFLFKKESGSISNRAPNEKGGEPIAAVRWFTLQKAIQVATFKGDKQMLKKAQKIITKRQKSPVNKSTIRTRSRYTQDT